ncbi:hypothetical protein SRHO_G00041060 [Serrasalmus rhombeus]
MKESQSTEAWLPYCLPMPVLSIHPYPHSEWRHGCMLSGTTSPSRVGGVTERGGLECTGRCDVCFSKAWQLTGRGLMMERERERPVHFHCSPVDSTLAPVFPKGSMGVKLSEPGDVPMQHVLSKTRIQMDDYWDTCRSLSRPGDPALSEHPSGSCLELGLRANSTAGKPTLHSPGPQHHHRLLTILLGDPGRHGTRKPMGRKMAEELRMVCQD